MKDHREIWRGLPRARREETALAFWRDCEDEDAVERALVYLVEHLRMRPQTVGQMGIRKRAKYLGRCGRPPADVAHAALVTYHLSERRALLARFLDELGVPNREGLIEDDEGLAPREPEALRTAIVSLRSEFPPDDVQLYLDMLVATDAPLWRALPGVREELAAEESTAPDAEAVRETGEADGEIDDPDSLEERSAREIEPVLAPGSRFDTMDRVVIRSIVDSVGHADHALSEDEARDLVQGLVQMNPSRHRSYFHLGFLDALQGQGARTDWPETNEDRRAWYLSGALSGYSRRGDTAQARALIEGNLDEFKLLGSGGHEASSLAVPLIFDAVWKGPEPSQVADLLRPRGLAESGMPILQRLLAESRILIHEQRGEEALPLIRLAERAVELLRQRGLTPPPDFQRDLTRRAAHCARLCGDFDAARAKLGRLLRSAPTPHEGMIRADLGLMACGMRSLADIRIPVQRSSWPAAARQLEAGLEHFEAAAAARSRGAHGEYCLGLHRLLSGRTSDALPLFDRCVAEMQQRPRTYRPPRILARARIGLAHCLAQADEPLHLERVVRLTERAVEDLGRESLALVEDLLAYLALHDENRATATCRALFAHLGKVVIDHVAEVQLLRRLPEVRGALLDRARDAAQPRAQRFRDYERLLLAARHAGDAELGEEAMDGLECLAERDPEQEAFLRLLDDPDRCDGVWDPDDVDFARVRLHERRGGYEQARAILERVGHRRLADGGEQAVPAVEGVLERIASYALEPDPSLAARVEALRSEREQAAPPDDIEAKVLFIGGDEGQADLAERVRAAVAATWPGVSLDFEHPCWSSNWGRQLDGLRTRIARADAVVLMPLVRTHLGRGVRRCCGEHRIPWVACTGKGAGMIERAIRHAVELVGRRGA